jgi:hypothetical protein
MCTRPPRILLLCLLPLWSCLEPPAAFEPVSLEQARALLAGGEVVLVDAVGSADSDPGPLPGGVRWQVERDQPVVAPDLPEGNLLLVGSSKEVGYSCAAVLAGARGGSVFVFIPSDAEQRRSLYVSPTDTEETRRGADS